MSLEWQQDCENESYDDDILRGAKRANKKSRQIKHPAATTLPIDEGDNNNNKYNDGREKSSSENKRTKKQ